MGITSADGGGNRPRHVVGKLAHAPGSDVDADQRKRIARPGGTDRLSHAAMA
jgi:hypothetical protein